ncbi:Pre-mRNA-splicing factor [Mucor velutinosus]|uniref:Pre-mRNA-splicing factor n=1 Tax=Mucor velutinosus TaxID=708070 RepID=A0AAN7D221_9FUNG|nr:Pre-mRNA-splicing factor [Mucor velutinosus]
MTTCSMPLSIKDNIIPFSTTLNSNYSIHDSFASFDSSTSSSTPATATRIIHNGDQETRIKQLHNQVEQLSLSNARLVRANRILKLDCDRIVEEQTTHLKQALKLSVEQNIRLQRANRLLRDDYLSQTEELNNIKMEQIRKMTNVGPEYEYLVQVINLLYRQLAGKSDCETTCCFTEKPLHSSSSLIVSPQKQQDNDEMKHICRPEIKSHNIPAGGLASALEQENNQLRDGMDILIDDRDALYQLLKDKEEDNETLKYELKVKDDIVKQLENDFEKMELEVNDLQKDYHYRTSNRNTKSNAMRSPDSSFSDLHSFPSVPT